MGLTHIVDSQACPVCVTPLDAAINVSGKAGPQDGDLTICIYCTTVLRFGPDGVLEMLSTEEWSRMSKEEQEFLSQVVSACLALKPTPSSM